MKKGQIALIVLVVSAIVMTVGLSLSRKSVVQTKITTDEELLKQAFNAAESGVDYYLGTGSTAYTSSDSQSSAQVAVSSLGGGSNMVNLGGITLRNTNNFTWLVGHNSDGSLDLSKTFGATAMSVCFDSAFDGSLSIEYFYKSGASYNVYREGYNIKTAGRVSGFTDAGVLTCIDPSNMNRVNLGIPLGGAIQPLLLVIKPIADDTKIVVRAAGGVFPDQETEISSTGRAGGVSSGTSSQVNREINVVNQYQVPAFMLEAVSASGNVLSN